MERFRLIFSGERCGKYAELPLEEHLKLLRISEKACDKIARGGRVSLKQGMDLAQMRQQKESLIKLGLVTEHQLQLDPEILKVGLRKPSQSSDSLELDSAVLQLDKTLLPTTIFRSPISSTLESDTDRKDISVELKNYQFSGPLLILVSAVMGLVMQTYLVVVLDKIGLPDIFATIMGIVFLLACFVLLPRLLQPLLALSVNVNDSEIDLYEQPQMWLGKKNFAWESGPDGGEIWTSSSSAQASSSKLFYEWSVHYHLQDTSEATLKSIQGSILEGTIVEIGQTLFDKLQPLFDRFSSSSDKKEIDWSAQPASAVCDASGKIVALIYQRNTAAYRITSNELSDNKLLHAFCVSILRASLV